MKERTRRNDEMEESQEIKKITFSTKLPTSGREVWRTIELSVDGKLIREYTSTSEGEKIIRDAGVTFPQRPRSLRNGLKKNPDPGESPAKMALSIMDPTFQPVADGDDKIRKSLTEQIRDITGTEPNQEKFAEIYRACIDHYAEAIRLYLQHRRGAGRATEGGEKEPVSPEKAAEIRKIQRDFLNNDIPCFFEGCDDLRQRRLEKIEAAGGKNCKSCNRSAINAEFVSLAVKAFYNSHQPEEEA